MLTGTGRGGLGDASALGSSRRGLVKLTALVALDSAMYSLLDHPSGEVCRDARGIRVLEATPTGMDTGAGGVVRTELCVPKFIRCSPSPRCDDIQKWSFGRYVDLDEVMRVGPPRWD